MPAFHPLQQTVWWSLKILYRECIIPVSQVGVSGPGSGAVVSGWVSAPCPAPSSSQCWADSLTYNIITISDQQEKIKTIIISISAFCFQEELVFQFLQRINKRETGITGDISHHWDNIIDMIHWDLSHYPAGARPQPTWDHQHKYYFISNLRNTELVTTVWAKRKIFHIKIFPKRSSVVVPARVSGSFEVLITRVEWFTQILLSLLSDGFSA